jgi:hypothetical protein
MTTVFLLFSRITIKNEEKQRGEREKSQYGKKAAPAVPDTSWPVIIKKSYSRSLGAVFRLLRITAPLYFIVALLVSKGVFRSMAETMPEYIKNWLTPEMMTVLSARIGGLLSAAGVASGMLHDGIIEQWQVLAALLAGNIITTPIRSFRRYLPVTLGVFPGRDGLLIVSILVTARTAFASAALLALLKINGQ